MKRSISRESDHFSNFPLFFSKPFFHLFVFFPILGCVFDSLSLYSIIIIIIIFYFNTCLCLCLFMVDFSFSCTQKSSPKIIAIQYSLYYCHTEKNYKHIIPFLFLMLLTPPNASSNNYIIF